MSVLLESINELPQKYHKVESGIIRQQIGIGSAV